MTGLSWLLHAHNAYQIDTAKIITEFWRIFNYFAWFNTAEFIRLQCTNDKRYDDVVFANLFRYQFAMFEFRLLVGLSWILHAHNAYKNDNSKIIAQFCRISFVFAWLYTVEFNCFRVQTTRCTMMWFSLIDFYINWLCTKGMHW